MRVQKHDYGGTKCQVKYFSLSIKMRRRKQENKKTEQRKQEITKAKTLKYKTRRRKCENTTAKTRQKICRVFALAFSCFRVSVFSFSRFRIFCLGRKQENTTAKTLKFKTRRRKCENTTAKIR